MGRKVPAGVGQVDAAAMPNQQRDPELAFQAGQLHRQWRLRQVQPGGCPGHRMLLGNRQEVPKLAQIHTEVYG